MVGDPTYESFSAQSNTTTNLFRLSAIGQGWEGGLFFIGTVGAAVNLAAVIKYNVTVDVHATVRPLGERRIVQAALAGIVKSILVKENQVVKKGQAIALIDPTQL